MTAWGRTASHLSRVAHSRSFFPQVWGRLTEEVTGRIPSPRSLASNSLMIPLARRWLSADPLSVKNIAGAPCWVIAVLTHSQASRVFSLGAAREARIRRLQSSWTRNTTAVEPSTRATSWPSSCQQPLAQGLAKRR